METGLVAKIADNVYNLQFTIIFPTHVIEHGKKLHLLL